MCRLLWQCLVIYLFFMFLHNDICSSSSSPSKPALCSPDQSFALLHFKNSFSLSDRTTISCDDGVSYPKTKRWKEGGDCCSWDGVTCDRLTGHIISLDVSCSSLVGTLYPNNTLFHLHHLRKLNLSYNDFSGSEISSMFGHFTKLTHLDLSACFFYGSVPPEIFYLSNLVSLDVSYNPIQLDQQSFDRLSQNLTNLRVLVLDYADLSSIAPSSFVNLSSSLISLHLRYTRLQGKFPNDVLRFPFLEQLDLSGNGPFIGRLPKSNWSSPLRHLDFSGSNFYGDHVMDDQIYLLDAISDLIYLNVLNLANCGLKGSIPEALSNLTRLRSLRLAQNGFSGRIPASIFNLTQLSDMDLSRNQLEGHFPSQVRGLPHLSRLDLSSNLMSGRIPSWLLALPSLQSLDLTYNNLTGPIDPFEQPGPVQYVFLQNNEIHGSLPDSIFELVNLVELDLFSNQLEGHFPSQVRSLPHLYKLDLSNNLLSGKIPSWLFTLPSLVSLDLENNKLTGPIDPFEQPGPLLDVNLANNKIHGSIPDSMFELVNLVQLDLSSNNLSGIVNIDLFSKLINLNIVHFSYNRDLSLRSHSISNFSLPKLTSFHFSSCNLIEFPISLRNFKNLTTLDLSNNKIIGQISQEELGLWQDLNYLDLSHNFLTRVVQIPLMKLDVLDLHSNLLQGPLAVPPRGASMTFFSVSHNNLTGEIPSTICNMSSLEYLVLANNNFSGMIPECLGNYEELKVLDLSMNNFHGSIPQIFPNGSSLKTIDLNGNQLNGPLPISLANCRGLEVLDVGNNMVNGTFPFWLATLPELQVLILRSNRFLGCIGNSETRSPFAKLRILDIAHNQFTGILPTKLFESFKTMMHGHDKYTKADYMGSYYYRDHVVLTLKGNELQFERILTILTAFDLSSNQFQGKIPEVVGKLKSLNVFNLSHNHLTGQIPSSLRNLIELESLDLSSNKLAGEIPMQLTSLTFLSMLNVSYNQLVGPIPRGNQFSTFENNSYIGNSKLCGPPLSKKCVNDEAPRPVQSTFKGEEDTWSTFDRKVMMMGYGSGLVIGLSIGYMVFSTRKPYWFVKIFNRDRRRKVIKFNRNHQRRNQQV